MLNLAELLFWMLLLSFQTFLQFFSIQYGGHFQDGGQTYDFLSLKALENYTLK